MVVGLAGPLALGQVVDATSSGSYGGFAGGDSLDVAFTFDGLGTLADWSIGMDLGAAVTMNGAATRSAAFSAAGTFGNDTPPVSWSQFLGAPVDTTGGVAAYTATFDIAGNADDTNSWLGVDAGSGDTFFSPDPGAVTYTGLAAGGALVPEPATMALLLAGMGGGLVARRRRRS